MCVVTAETFPLSVASLKNHVPVIPQNVTDDALQALLNAAETEINARRGALGDPIVERHFAGLRTFWLARPAASAGDIASIVEDEAGALTTLASDDWYLHPNLMLLVRLKNGTHPSSRWASEVVTTFTPLDDTSERIRVQVALVKLDLAFTGWASVSTQSEGRTALADYKAEREALLSSFALTTRRAA